MTRMQGKAALITGGASGIGAATVRRFVAEGARVTIADRDEEKGAALAGELGDEVLFVPTDVSVERDVAEAIARTLDEWGQLDCLFNNAGFGGALGPIGTTSVEDFDLTFDVLVKSVFLGMKHAAEHMMARGSGSIINNASVCGLIAGMGPHLYSAAKAAVIALSKTAALEFGHYGVRVNAICPGTVATPAHGREPEGDTRRDRAGRARLQDAHPDRTYRRPGRPGCDGAVSRQRRIEFRHRPDTGRRRRPQHRHTVEPVARIHAHRPAHPPPPTHRKVIHGPANRAVN